MNIEVGAFPENARFSGTPIRFKVLVVDAPGPNLDSLVGVLREVGYNVDTASDSEATYRKLRSSVRPVDLLIIDLDSLDGVDVLRFLKVLNKDESCTNTRIVLTVRGSIDKRLVAARNELAICASFNKLRPVEELIFLITSILPPRGHNLRASYRFPVKFLVHYEVGKNHQLLYASNLGLGGIFICNSEPDPVGTIALLAFALPGNTNTVQLKAEAKVVRVVQHTAQAETLHYQTFPQGNGLVFTEMSAEHHRLLKAFCDQEEIRILRMPVLLSNAPVADGRDQTRS